MEREQRSPKTAAQQDAPEPERPVTPEEEAGMDLQQLDNPPQAEGPRESSDDLGRHPGNR